MRAWQNIESIAAPLNMVNIDTDMIIPKQFLKTIKRTGLGQYLFYELRFDMEDQPNQTFILNQTPFNTANILIAGENFGCGSSREHAPWALLDFGFHCVIAPSFADIFFNNCFKNGILAITLPEPLIKTLMAYAETQHRFVIDLAQQTIHVNDKSYPFEIDAFRKKCLLEGLDDIGLTLMQQDKINAYEAKQKQLTPWLF